MNYTITQAAERIGLTAHTLRYYEKEGLLPFVERTESGIRAFKEDDFEWLELITCLKNTGMHIKDIRQFIQWCYEGDATLTKRLNMFKKQKETVKAQMEELQRCEQKIDYKIWYYETACEAGTEEVVKGTKCK